MRNIDKGYLLDEIVTGNTSQSALNNLIQWIKASDAYDELVRNIEDVKASTSLYALILYEKYYELAIEEISSIEEALVAYAKILYLAQVSRKECFINPLIAEKSIDYSFKMKDIAIFYDSHLITLEDFQKSSDYTLKQKGEAIKEQIRSWEDDLTSKLYSVIDEIKEYPRNMHNLKILNVRRSIELILLVIFDTLVILALFSPFQKVYEIIHNQYELSFIFYLTAIAFTFIGIWNAFFIIEFTIKFKQYHKYNYAKNRVLGNKEVVASEITKASEKLKSYLETCLLKNRPLNASVLDFAFDQNVIGYIQFLYYVNFRGKHPRKNKIFLMSKIFMALSLVFGITSFVFIILHLVGRL
jgi:gas vesicle protein